MATVKSTANIQFLNRPAEVKPGRADANFKSAAWTGEQLLYWGKRLDVWQLIQDRIKLIIKNLINGLLILIGITGVALLAKTFYLMQQAGLPVWEFYRVRSLPLLAFWLSLVFDSYLLYRLYNDLAQYKTIIKKQYTTTTGTFQPIDWSEISTFHHDRFLDISPYFTYQAVLATQKAWQLASKYGSTEVRPIHLFLAVLTLNQTSIILGRLGIAFSSLKPRISQILGRLAKNHRQPTLSGEFYQLLFLAYFVAWQRRETKVEVTDLLEAMSTEFTGNEVFEVFYDLNIDNDKVKNVIAWLRIQNQLAAKWHRFRGRAVFKPKNNMNRSMTAIATPILNAFGQDLTLLARAGYLLPCIGRDDEISQIFQTMQGGSRRSVVLIGQPGVGKQTIIEGIAQMMVEENVPLFLQDKRLVSLSVAKLVSGATPAVAQERLLALLYEVKRSANIVLIINEIHNLVGISIGGAGSIDLAGALAQAMADQRLLIIATSNPVDYTRYVEGKSQLENALEPLPIKEVSGNQAIQILEAKAGAIEYQQQVYFSYAAIEQTVKLSDRYLHDRCLPEKAIEILHDAATHVHDTKGKNALVTANDVAEVISLKTNIPLTQITATESEKLLHLEEQIHQRIVGQDEAVKMVASSLRRARAEMRELNRPIVNLLFLGPTGVGKTEVAKTVSEVYFKSEKYMVRIDMSEYQEQSSVNKLIGAPPGFGDEETGQLTDAVRKNPFSLVLFDELEKAHPKILDLLLQIMDDGRLTDSSGRTVDFTNTIVIATSNAGTQFIQDGIKSGLSLADIKKQLLDQQLQHYFKPEFLNRFDGIVVFKPLSLPDVEAIARLMLNKVAENLETKGVELKVTPQALTELAQAGFDPTLGARPLRRVIQDRVRDVLANYLISGQIKRRDTVIIESGLEIKIQPAENL